MLEVFTGFLKCLWRGHDYRNRSEDWFVARIHYRQCRRCLKTELLPIQHHNHGDV